MHHISIGFVMMDYISTGFVRMHHVFVGFCWVPSCNCWFLLGYNMYLFISWPTLVAAGLSVRQT